MRGQICRGTCMRYKGNGTKVLTLKVCVRKIRWVFHSTNWTKMLLKRQKLKEGGLCREGRKNHSKGEVEDGPGAGPGQAPHPQWCCIMHSKRCTKWATFVAIRLPIFPLGKVLRMINKLQHILRRQKLCTFFFATQKLLLRPFGGGFWEMCNNTPSNEDRHTDSDNAWWCRM